MNKLKHVKEIGKKMKKSTADGWVDKYQKKNKKAAFGWLYGSDVLQALIDEGGSDGIWFFKGINDAGEERLVLYPADSEGNILNNKVKSLGAMGSDDDDGAVDSGTECPENCPGGLG